MGPALRKGALTLHVAASVGWMGAVAAFLALALAGLWSGEAATVQGNYVAMDVTARFVLVPLAFAALASGVVQGLGTPWGLFRHWWVVAKLVVTVVSTLLLLLHMQVVAHVGHAAAEAVLAPDDLRPMRVQLVANAAAALVALLAATVLSIYKPKGLTAYGWRKLREERARAKAP